MGYALAVALHGTMSTQTPKEEGCTIAAAARIIVYGSHGSLRSPLNPKRPLQVKASKSFRIFSSKRSNPKRSLVLPQQ